MASQFATEQYNIGIGTLKLGGTTIGTVRNVSFEVNEKMVPLQPGNTRFPIGHAFVPGGTAKGSIGQAEIQSAMLAAALGVDAETVAGPPAKKTVTLTNDGPILAPVYSIEWDSEFDEKPVKCSLPQVSIPKLGIAPKMEDWTEFNLDFEASAPAGGDIVAIDTVI